MEKKVKIYTESSFLSLLGLAARGRNLVSGEDQVLEAIRAGTAQLVVIAGDISEGNAKRFRDKTTYYGVPLRRMGSKESLGKAIGRDYRSCVAVTDIGLASKLLEMSDSIEDQRT